MALRGGQRRPERAGAPVGGGVRTPASHLCVFAWDASRGHRVGFPARSKACLGRAGAPAGRGSPQGRRAEGRWHSAGSCYPAACERAARPAPSPPPSPAAAAAHRPLLDCSACSAGRVGFHRPGGFAPWRTQTPHALHPRAYTRPPRWLHWLGFSQASRSVARTHSPSSCPLPAPTGLGASGKTWGVTGGRLGGSAHTHLAGSLPEAHVAGGSGSRRP